MTHEIEVARCAGESTARRELLRVMLQSLRSQSARPELQLAFALMRQSLLAAISSLRGELLAPFSPALTAGDTALSAAANAAARDVVAEFELELRDALG